MIKNILLVIGITGIFLGSPIFKANAVPQKVRIEEKRHLRAVEYRRTHDRHERLRYLREAERRNRHNQRNDKARRR
jgi:hypothetical protein